MAGQNATARTKAVEADAANALAPLGLTVEDVAVTPAGKRRLVRVLVDVDLPEDHPSTESVPPLDLDRIADATRAVSQALDASNAMGEAPYVLEVSSPGTDRPLTLPRHFRRNVGRLVAFAFPDEPSVTGRILAADGESVTLATDDGQRTVPYDGIEQGTVQIEFNRVDDEGEEEH